MRTTLAAMAWIALVSLQVTAQDTSPVLDQTPETEACQPVSSALGGRYWVNADYLLWWTKNGPQSFPLVTTGNPAVAPAPGSLDQPSTRVLFGGDGLDFGASSGVRVNVGRWFGEDATWGVEAGGFTLESQRVRFAGRSAGTGQPPIYVPLFQADPALNHEGSVIISDPAQGMAGSIGITASSQLWGLECNGLRNLRRCECWNLDLIAGFCYLNLHERLRLDTNVTDFVFDIQNREHDDFDTRNQFYGGQVGARLGWRRGGLRFDFTGKVALGDIHQVVDIDGSNTQTGRGATNGVFPGGIFTMPTNIGQRSRDAFAVAPQAQVKASIDLTRRLAASIAYDFLYVSSVVRPGDQMDRVVNQTQQLGGPLVGAPRPGVRFDTSDFWSQGMSFGLEFRF